MNGAMQAAMQEQVSQYTELPWLTLVVLCLPLVLVAWKLKIYPAVWWILVLLVSTFASVATIFQPSFLFIAAMLDLGLVGVATVDLLLVYLYVGLFCRLFVGSLLVHHLYQLSGLHLCHLLLKCFQLFILS